MNLLARLSNFVEGLLATLFNPVQSVALLGARFYVGWAFFASGLTKIGNWGNTLDLFEYEYAVPVLSPQVAAVLGTAGELVLPILLFAGLLSRFGALGLSVVNVVAVVSLEDIAPAAYSQHLLWGALLLMVVLWGGGKLSLDHWFKSKAS